MKTNIQKYRQNRLAKFCQILLVREDGYLVESCDSIFSTTNLKDTRVPEWFPFIESIFDSLCHLSINDKEMLFSKVEVPADFLPGYYDFTFSKILVDNVEFILWEIYDYTTIYEDFRNYQQKRNELEIQRQILTLKNKKINSVKDIYNKENISMNTSVKNKKNDSITAINVLDVVTHSINTITDNYNEDFLLTLKKIAATIENTTQELTINKQNSYNSNNNEIFSLIKILHEVLPIIESKHKNTKVLNVYVDEDLPKNFQGNSLDIKRIILGLAANAAAFNTAPELEIHFSQKQFNNTHCTLSIGVTALSKNKNDFQSINEIIIRLAIIKKIIESHNGSLEIKKSDQFGSHIICNFPLKKHI